MTFPPPPPPPPPPPGVPPPLTRTSPYDFNDIPPWILNPRMGFYAISTLDIQSQSGFMLKNTLKNHAWTFQTFSCDTCTYTLVYVPYMIL